MFSCGIQWSYNFDPYTIFFFVEISMMFWFCHICVARMVVLIPKCTSLHSPAGMDSAPDQEFNISLSFVLICLTYAETYLPPVRIFFTDGFSAVQGQHKCHKIQEDRAGRVAVSQYRVVSYRGGGKTHSFTLISISLLWSFILLCVQCLSTGIHLALSSFQVQDIGWLVIIISYSILTS